MVKTMKEIVKTLLSNVDDCKDKEGMLQIEEYYIDQAIADIIALLPEEKIHQGKKNNSRFNHTVDGYNQAVKDCREVIEKGGLNDNTE